MIKKIVFLLFCFIIYFPIICLGQLTVKTSFTKDDRCFLVEIINDKSNSDAVVFNATDMMEGLSVVAVDFYNKNGESLFSGGRPISWGRARWWSLGSESRFIIKENEDRSFKYNFEELGIDLTYVYKIKVDLRIKYIFLNGEGFKLIEEELEYIL